MFFSSWLSFRLPGLPPTPDSRRGRRPTRLHVEVLEDRCLLASAMSATLVADVVPGAFGSAPDNLTNVQDTLYFNTTDPATLTQGLWKSDGTASGTVAVKPGIAGRGFTALGGGVVLFVHDSELWKTDGTTQGTLRVKQVAVDRQTVVNGKLFFRGTDNNGQELWVSDGTTGGTKVVKDIYSGSYIHYKLGCSGGNCYVKLPNDSSPSYLTDLNGILLFAAKDGISGNELWRSDGTAKGTTLVKDISPGLASSWPHDLTVMNQVLYFGAAGGLWKSDGTATGTVLVTSVVEPFNLTNVKGTQFFNGRGSTTDFGLWKSDGTAAGTVLVKDIAGLAPWSGLTNVNGMVYFEVGVGIDQRQLWKSDGTETGTVLLRQFTTRDILELTNVNGLLYFVGEDADHGRELWQSDGTKAGTVMVQDIYPGSQGSWPWDLTAMNNKLYFSADDGIHGRELWDPPAVESPFSNFLVNDPSALGVSSATSGPSEGAGAGSTSLAELALASSLGGPKSFTNAAGWGWFVDPTPWDDSEFTTAGDQRELNRIDLVTALEHELGHILGYEHAAGGLMDELLATGIRATPTAMLDQFFATV